MSFAASLKLARVNARKTQAEIARALDVVTQSVSAWETGRALPSPELHAKLEQELGVKLLLDRAPKATATPSETGLELLENFPLVRERLYDYLGALVRKGVPQSLIGEANKFLIGAASLLIYPAHPTRTEAQVLRRFRVLEKAVTEVIEDVLADARRSDTKRPSANPTRRQAS